MSQPIQESLHSTQFSLLLTLSLSQLPHLLPVKPSEQKVEERNEVSGQANSGKHRWTIIAFSELRQNPRYTKGIDELISHFKPR